MLFSRDDVARYIDNNFEAAWEMVRPVPLIRIDFGNNHVITRTLNGNIATYVCAGDGQALDVLPGIYAPAEYLAGLYQLRLLANYVDQQGKAQRQARLRAYHQRQAEAIKNNQPREVFINTAGRSKAAIEGGIRAVLVSSDALSKEGGAALRKRAPVPLAGSKTLGLADKEDVAHWKLLQEDTRLNETARRQRIHEIWTETRFIRPEQITKRLYKEVLHTDLDDPYLGLANLLFANYPFDR